MELNLAVLDELPEEGDWPWLVRSMFAATPGGVFYVYRTLHFAATMKGLDEVWPEWLARFESLLRRMEWTSVTLHLETETNGDHSYRWTAEGPKAGSPVQRWTFEGEPRQFDKPSRPRSPHTP